jgi:hypothetical protein
MSGLLSLVSSRSQEVAQEETTKLTGCQKPAVRMLPRPRKCTDPYWFSVHRWHENEDQSRLLWQALQVNVRLSRNSLFFVLVPDPFKTLCAHP